MYTSPSWLVRTALRLIDFTILTATLGLVVFQIFPSFNSSQRLVWAIVSTYLISAYIVLPISVRLRGFLTRRRRVPRYTSSVDGLPTDPVNVIVEGSLADLRRAYAKSGWSEAETLGPRTAMKMAYHFIVNKSYPTAPFSRLYLFGRKQDIGFQKEIDGSPRKRHHVRYWAFDESKDSMNDLINNFWHGKSEVNLDAATTWAGAVTRDTGFGFTKGTWQITHSVDNDTVFERDFMVSELQNSGTVEKVEMYVPKSEMRIFGKINKFYREDKMAMVSLKEK